EHKQTVRQIYAQRLVEEGAIAQGEADAMVQRHHRFLEAEFARKRERPTVSALRGIWTGYRGAADASVPDLETGVARETLQHDTERVTTVPEGFVAHPKIVRLLNARRQMGLGEQPIDWGMGEAL